MALPRLVTLSHKPYLVHPEVLAEVTSGSVSDYIQPALLIHGDKPNDTALAKLVTSFSAADDVFCDEFAQHVITDRSLNVPGGQGHQVTLSLQDTKLPQGPYFLQGKNVHQAWRLYEDSNEAFVTTIIPESLLKPDRFLPLHSLSSDGVHHNVAVPSRLYSAPSSERPLSGVRISVKDNIDIRGIKTTLMSRSYTNLYPPRDTSASVISELVSKGAIIVGKTKLSAFASAEEPTDQWIDYHCPWNPRGDEYQSPSGSTTGGATSLAAYPWLDFSIGTDTTGSIRAPASCTGLFALRATYNTVDMEGIATRCHALDTLGLLGRDLSSFRNFAASVLQVPVTKEKPQRLLYPTDFFPHGNAAQQAMVDEFVKVMESGLGVQAIPISIQDRWAQCPPTEAGSKSLKEYLAKSAFWPMYYDLYHETEQFREDYRQKYGKECYVGPYVRWSWETAKNVTLREKEQGLFEMGVFRKWFNDNVMSSLQKAGPDAVMIMPNGRPVPKYRDDPNGPPGVIGSFTENYFAAVLELPQLIVPIGQNSYESRISGRTEHRPIVCSLVGPKGSDLMLMDLVKAAFQKAKWPTKVETGRYMFTLAKNVRNTKDIDHEAKM